MFTVARRSRFRSSASWLVYLLALGMAACGGTNSSSSLTLTRVEVTPSAVSRAAGTQQQYVAMAIFSDDTRQNVSADVTWSSSDTGVATISNTAGENGLARTLAPGTTTVTASFQSQTGSATLTVTAATLVSLAVTPVAPSIAKGTSQQFVAMGMFTDGSVQDVTAAATWSSSDPAVATISNSAGSNGLAQSLAEGATTIAAVYQDRTASTPLTVTAAVLSRIDVTPPSPSVPRGRTQQFTATAVFTDSSTQDLTTSVVWSSSDSNIANISNAVGSQGLAATNNIGVATIGAAFSGITGTTALTVIDATLSAIQITVTPPAAAPTLPRGFQRQFTATGLFSDNSNRDITADVIWTSTNTARATISNQSGSQGLATGVTAGATTITASRGSVVGSVGLTVSNATLRAINVQPANQAIALGLTQAFSATGRFSDSTTLDLTAQVTWTSSNTATATISNAAGSRGLASSVATGATVISATFAATTGTTALTVTAASLNTITVAPAAGSTPAGTSLAFTATGAFSDGSTRDITGDVTWSSSDATIATISNAGPSKGVSTTVRVGTATITAALAARTGTAGLTVTDAVLSSIAVTPANRSLPLGLSRQFTATGRYSDNSLQDLTGSVTWASSDTAVATISNAIGSAGLASTLGIGTTTIKATLGAINGQTDLTVTAVSLQSIGLTPTDASAAAGTMLQYSAVGTYSDGSTQDLTRAVTWSSSQPAIADISNDSDPDRNTQGLAFARAVGSVTITAVLPGTSNRVHTLLTVTAATLNAIVVTPADVTVPRHYSLQYTATGLYSDGSSADLTQQVGWTTLDGAIATVGNDADNKGIVTGLSAGSTNVVATMGAIDGQTRITVSDATLTSIAVTPDSASIARGATLQYTATGTFSDGQVLPMTTQVNWVSSNTAVATISNAAGSQGLAVSSPLFFGTVTISARSNLVVGATDLLVRF